jgi:hypothetical protein
MVGERRDRGLTCDGFAPGRRLAGWAGMLLRVRREARNKEAVRFKATDVFDYFKPSRCERRVALRASGEPEQDTDTAFLELLRSLGRRHEEAHVATLPSLVDLSSLDQADRDARPSTRFAAAPCRFTTRASAPGSTSMGRPVSSLASPTICSGPAPATSM